MIDISRWTNPSRLETAYEGIERRVLAYTDEIMLVHYTVEEGAEFPTHDHETTHQAVYVVSGSVELTGDHEAVLGPGDSFVVGPSIEHGIIGRAPRTELLDAFAPPIDDYRDEK